MRPTGGCELSTAPLDALLAEARDRLTPAELRLAQVLVDDPALAAFGTVAEVAAAGGTSGPTVVRFAGKLGFDGWTTLQERVRGDVARRLARPGDRLRAAQGPALQSARDAAEDGLAAGLVAGEDEQALAQVAARLATADAVWLLSGELSGATARVLAAGLALLRGRVRLVEPAEAALSLADAGPRDVAVVVDFPRHRRDVTAAAARLAAAGTHVVAMTDGPLSPLVAHADRWFGLVVPAVGPADSAVPGVVLAELLVALVADELGTAAGERLERVEAAWDDAGTHLADD